MENHLITNEEKEQMRSVFQMLKDMADAGVPSPDDLSRASTMAAEQMEVLDNLPQAA